MAISSLDAMIAGMLPLQRFLKIGATMEAAGVLHSLLYTSGIPGAGAAPAPGLAGAALTTYAGQIPFSNPVSGNSYLALFEGGMSALDGQLILYDRLWHNSGIGITTPGGQTITSVAWPARDNNGSTNGEGVYAALEVSGATGNGAAITTTTLTYTNSAGTGSRTATMASFPQTAAAGSFIPFQLQAGDTGIRSIQTLTLGTSYTSGTVHLVAYRELGPSLNLGVYRGDRVDAVSSGFPRLYDNTVPCLLWMPSAVTAVTIRGAMGVAQG